VEPGDGEPVVSDLARKFHALIQSDALICGLDSCTSDASASEVQPFSKVLANSLFKTFFQKNSSRMLRRSRNILLPEPESLRNV
jgi:hypothetical protein